MGLKIMSKEYLLTVGQKWQLCQMMYEELGYEIELCTLLWKTKLKDAICITKATYRIERIEHYFEFDLSGGRWCLRYTKNIPILPPKTVTVTKWEQVIPHFRDWAKNLLVEIKATEQWAAVATFPLQVPSIDNGSMLIEPTQQKNIQDVLKDLLQKILGNFHPIDEQKNFIKVLFSQLRTLLSSFSRSAWVHTFIGIVVSIGLQLGVSIANNDPFWQLIRDALNRITQMLF